MAKRMKDDAKPKTRAGSNGFDPEVLNSVVKRIEGVFTDLDSERGSYMARCKSLREDVANLYEEAKARGVPVKSLKKAVKARDLTRKIEALRDDLDLVDRDSYDNIRLALGDLADLPLGQAATRGAPGAPDEERDLRPSFLKGGVTEDEADRIAAANEKALKSFIKPLGDGTTAA